jgi:hypothetical protein
MRAQTPEDILESPLWIEARERVLSRIDKAMHVADPEDGTILRRLAHERRAVETITLELSREMRDNANLRKAKK